MIWANVTKFGQNFIAPRKFFGLVRLCSLAPKSTVYIRRNKYVAGEDVPRFALMFGGKDTSLINLVTTGLTAGR